jgi:hypothetical protein
MRRSALGHDSNRVELGWQLDAIVVLGAVGLSTGSFVCFVARYLLPGMDFDYGKWAGVGTALGVTLALVWILADSLYGV